MNDLIQSLPQSGEWAPSFDVPIAAPVEPPQKVIAAAAPMAIVLPFIEREREQVLRLLALIQQLSGELLRRSLYLVPFKGLRVDDVLDRTRTAFTDVHLIADNEGAACDWKKDDKVRDAAGPNSLFRQAAWFFHLKRPDAEQSLGPWLWLEPDCVPLVRGWDDMIEEAYRAAGKPFFGARMKFQSGEDYLNGAAVYPRDAVGRAPALVTRATWAQFPEMEIAFDVAGGMEVLRQSHFTDLIQLDYRGSAEPREGAVLLHGDRDGAVMERLLNSFPVTKGASSGAIAGVAPKSGTPAPVIPANGSNGHSAKSRKRYEKCGLTVNRRPTETLRDYKLRLQTYRDRWSARNPGKTTKSQRSSHLRNKFGLTIEQYEELFHAQNGQCAVCKCPAKTKTSLNVDHCHQDGRVRGLLCNNCNVALGLLKESETAIEALRDYVRFTKSTIGDQIRFHVGQLVRLATNANRKTRILAELRKTNLLPRIAR